MGKRVDGVIVVLDDINTLTTFELDKDDDFANNRVIRVVDNTETGRDIFKSQLISNFILLQDLGAIQNFAASDITVSIGTGKGDIQVAAYVQPVDCMKKLYMIVYER